MKRSGSLCAVFTLGVMILFSGQLSGAGRLITIPTSPESKIRIEIQSWFDACPPTGIVPLVVRITNGSDRAHEWTITARESYGGGVSTSLVVSADAGKTVEIPFYPATGNRDGSSPWRQMYFSVQGPSAAGATGDLPHPATLHPGAASSAAMPFLVMSSGIALQTWIPLADKFDKAPGGSRSFDATQVDMSKAPEDWRGYTGVGQLWMTDGEWSGLGTASKSAMLEWIALGGRIRVFCSDVTEPRLSAMKIPPAGPDGVRRAGAGKIEVQSWSGSSLPVANAVNLAEDRGGVDIMEERLSKYSRSFSLPQTIGAPQLRSGLIFIFIAVFGTLVGPVNLYWFSRPGRRQRLFWITPLISVAASLLLIALMIFQDGIGGSGARRVLAILQPAQNKIGILQEQVSRTGVLLGRSFKMQEPSWMEKVPLETDNSSFNPRGGRNVELRETDDGMRSGDWFVNRALQAHLLQTVRPSRGQIDVFPGTADNDPPSLLSSLGVTMESVFVIDEKGRVWTASSVATGEKKKMVAAKLSDCNDWLQTSIGKDAGPVLQAALNPLRSKPGMVFAASTDTSKFAVRTLDSINWKDDRVIFAGPYVKHDQP